MAGAGYKLFNTGDVLTAAQVNTYLQEQTVMVFASSTARTTALSGVLAEGMMSYLQDTNAVEVYNGSAWVGVSGAGDVTEVQAGTGISVASGTGPIPVVTNTMATEIAAAGDIIVGTGSGTFDNLPIGTTGQVLTADTTVSPYKVKWATAASGSTFKGVLATNSVGQTANSGSTTTLTFNSEDYDTDSFHSTSSNTSRLTVPSTGYYLVWTKIRVQGNSSGYRYINFRKNGSTSYQDIINYPNHANDFSMYFAMVLAATANDYFEVQYTQNSGSSLEVRGSDNGSIAFGCSYLGA